MKKLILTLLLACLLFPSCASLKKYRALGGDYQRCSEDQHAYEQMKRCKKCEKIML